MESFEGDFLRERYWPKEEFRKAAEKSGKKEERLAKGGGSGGSRGPEKQIFAYLERLERVAGRIDPETGERGKLFLEASLYPQFVIKPENISDEYIKGILLGNFAETRGYDLSVLKNEEIKQEVTAQFKQVYGQDFGAYEVPDKERQRIKSMVIMDQKARISAWLDYLTSEEARNAPAAFRYWAFAEMLKLGGFNEERKTFNKRTEHTAASFPELDQQALALVFDETLRKRKGDPSRLLLSDPIRQAQFRKILESENFGKLYAFALEHVNTLRLPTERLIITKGEWRCFPKGTPAGDLTKTLQGFNTKWYIAGDGYAEGYLSHADIYIYYSEDADGKNDIPRACIVDAKAQGITEVRGILSSVEAKQHLDSYITPVVEEKLATLPGGEKWQSTMADMKKLALIHFKYLQNEALDREDLRFLYEIERPIQRSGYESDPRIDEIKQHRNPRDDISFAIGVPPERVSITEDEALTGNIAFHYGYLNLSGLASAEGLILPQSIGGYLGLKSLVSAKGLTLPQSIGGGLYLSGLASAERMKLRSAYPHLAHKIQP